MDKDSIDVIMDEAKDYWIAQTGRTEQDDFDAADAVAKYCDFTQDELNVIAHYVKGWSMQVLARVILEAIAESGNTEGGIDSEQLIQMVIEATMPVTMCVTKHRAGNKVTRKSGGEYITTVFAEATIRTAISSGRNLDDIWPQPIVEEVLDKFSPEEAFRIGVLCGQNG